MAEFKNIGNRMWVELNIWLERKSIEICNRNKGIEITKKIDKKIKNGGDYNGQE